MNYGFSFEGKVYGPDGLIQTTDVNAHNNEIERTELEWLQTSPDHVFLYVRANLKTPSSWDITNGQNGPAITTWLGTQVSTHLWIGPRRYVGFNGGFHGHTYRRAVTCRIFGVLYHGWYMESSGNYCRLRKAKVQS